LKNKEIQKHRKNFYNHKLNCKSRK